MGKNGSHPQRQSVGTSTVHLGLMTDAHAWVKMDLEDSEDKQEVCKSFENADSIIKAEPEVQVWFEGSKRKETSTTV